ncbi:MAG: hypothetical protein U0791_00585 [Gemmataceae bacterium]
MQPRSDSGRGLNRGRSLGENQECGLECVVRIGGVAKHAATHAENHAAVSSHEFGERIFIPAANVPLQQVAVGRSFESVPGELRDQPRHRVLSHDTGLWPKLGKVFRKN